MEPIREIGFSYKKRSLVNFFIALLAAAFIVLNAIFLAYQKDLINFISLIVFSTLFLIEVILILKNLLTPKVRISYDSTSVTIYYLLKKNREIPFKKIQLIITDAIENKYLPNYGYIKIILKDGTIYKINSIKQCSYVKDTLTNCLDDPSYQYIEEDKLLKFFVRIFNYSLAFIQYFIPWKEPKVLKDYDSLTTLYKERGITKVMIVSDNNIIKLNLLNNLTSSLIKNNIKYVIYSEIDPNPTVDNVNKGKEIYIKEKAEALIALGGGSVLDAAKGIGIIITNHKPIGAYKGLFKVPKKIPHLVAIPTTSGTGSETTLAAVIRDPLTFKKYKIESNRIVPLFTLFDPTLLLNLPKQIFATTAMDALTHAIESYLNTSATIKTRKYALDAIEIITRNITKIYKDPTLLKEKAEMLHASYLAGLSFNRAMVGNIHALAHPLGGKYNLAHGYLNAIILPQVLKTYLINKRAVKKMSKIMIRINPSLKENNSRVNANKLIAYLFSLNDSFALPRTIKEIKLEDLVHLSFDSYKEAVPLYGTPLIYSKAQFFSMYLNLKSKE
ncbi:MAG TPA: iron-containing alcohol dehydrogenase [Candidatus Onthovivens sp.]|nr:iron-containing alcohol dehydrogenase [Candidatus Onthovivens sp.]